MAIVVGRVRRWFTWLAGILALFLFGSGTSQAGTNSKVGVNPKTGQKGKVGVNPKFGKQESQEAFRLVDLYVKQSKELHNLLPNRKKKSTKKQIDLRCEKLAALENKLFSCGAAGRAAVKKRLAQAKISAKNEKAKKTAQKGGRRTKSWAQRRLAVLTGLSASLRPTARKTSQASQVLSRQSLAFAGTGGGGGGIVGVGGVGGVVGKSRAEGVVGKDSARGITIKSDRAMGIAGASKKLQHLDSTGLGERTIGLANKNRQGIEGANKKVRGIEGY